MKTTTYNFDIENTMAELKSSDMSDFGKSTLEFAEPMIKEVLMTRPDYYFNLSKDIFIKEVNQLITKFIDENGEEFQAIYEGIEHFFIELFQKIFLRVFETKNEVLIHKEI